MRRHARVHRVVQKGDAARVVVAEHDGTRTGTAGFTAEAHDRRLREHIRVIPDMFASVGRL